MGISVLDCSQIAEAAAFIRQQCPLSARVGLVLGSGLGGLAEQISGACLIPYADIPHFPISGAPGHRGQLCIGTLFGVTVVLMQGRVHMYEGYTAQQTTFPVRVMAELGVCTLVVTNAAGGISKCFEAGDLMLIEDHINLVGMSGFDPTRGPHVEQLGPRFTPLNGAYNLSYRRTIEKIALEKQINMFSGVYAFVAGPCFETPAEIRFLSNIGADAVGMSTVPEIMVARNAGMKVLAISAITNMSIHEIDSEQQTTEEEVWENVVSIVPKLSALIAGFLKTLG